MPSVTSRLEQQAKSKVIDRARFDKKRSISQLNYTQNDFKSKRHQSTPREWRDGVMKIFDIEKSIKEER